MTTHHHEETTTMRVPPSPDATTPTDRTPEPVRGINLRSTGATVAALDLDAIRLRADAATPGPWAADGIEGRVYAGYGLVVDGVTMWAETDAQHIAGMDPATTLALVGEVRRLWLIHGPALFEESMTAVIRRAEAAEDALARVTREAEALRAQVAELPYAIEETAAEDWGVSLQVPDDAQAAFIAGANAAIEFASSRVRAALATGEGK